MTLTAASETPLRIPFGDAHLAGVLTEPAGEPNGLGVIVFHGGGDFNLPSHRNRWTAMLARRLAADGFHVVRFGYKGVGDSSGDLDPHTQERPLVEQGRAVASHLLSRPGVEGIVFVGSCFGARTALGAAAATPEARGAILASMSIADQQKRHAHQKSAGDMIKRAVGKDGREALRRRGRRRRYAQIAVKFVTVRIGRVFNRARGVPPDAAPWVSDRVLGPLETLVDRGVPVVLAYGQRDEFYEEYQAALPGRFGRVVERGVTIDANIERRLHGFPSVVVQDAFVELVHREAVRLAGAGPELEGTDS